MSKFQEYKCSKLKCQYQNFNNSLCQAQKFKGNVKCHTFKKPNIECQNLVYHNPFILYWYNAKWAHTNKRVRSRVSTLMRSKWGERGMTFWSIQCRVSVVTAAHQLIKPWRRGQPQASSTIYVYLYSIMKGQRAYLLYCISSEAADGPVQAYTDQLRWRAGNPLAHVFSIKGGGRGVFCYPTQGYQYNTILQHTSKLKTIKYPFTIFKWMYTRVKYGKL